MPVMTTLVGSDVPRAPDGTIVVTPVPMQWDASLPVFAKPQFLAAVGDECGWLGGVDGSGSLRCVLPYTVVRRAGLRMVRFRVATIACGQPLDVQEERRFLNAVVAYFRSTRSDVIIPASNNAIFRTYPDGACAAPYGSYAIDLRQPEEVLWKSIGRITRQNIGTARRDGVSVCEGMEWLDAAYHLIRETFYRSKLRFMSRDAFERFARGLGENGRLFRAALHGVAHSYCLCGFSSPCAYAIYAGNVEGQHQGANKLLYWEAMRAFRTLGVQKFDFYGARVNPREGSKQEAINRMKKRFGATLSAGYLWKYSLRPSRAWLYSIGARVLRGGDIVDRERHKLPGYESNGASG